MSQHNEIIVTPETKVSSTLQGWLAFISFLMMAGGFLMGFSVGLDKANARIDSVVEEVKDIQDDRSERLKLYTDNQIKLEGRLSRIETVLVQMNNKLQ